MIIHAKFIKEDETIEQKDFYDWHEFTVYVEEHHGKYLEVSARKGNDIE